jgi:23S rRNA (cytidine1920-2'-O)/16S rRNA (cytidine1409-2'-O)-methyltransferase
VIEHFNARHLTPQDLPDAVDIVVVDVSFISLRYILPVIPPIVRPGADVVVLVKPQFEAGRADAPKGVVRDPAVRDRVVRDIATAATEVGLAHVATTPSPITGQEGNVEFLLHLRPAA